MTDYHVAAIDAGLRTPARLRLALRRGAKQKQNRDEKFDGPV
ncbi:MAG TPA: hypothetical protein VH985_10965 [Candidatus Binatia bacterium]